MTGQGTGARRPDWLIALAMLVGAAVPIALMAFFFGPAPWSAVAAGLLAFPGGFIGGCIAVAGEDDKSDW